MLIPLYPLTRAENIGEILTTTEEICQQIKIYLYFQAHGPAPFLTPVATLFFPDKEHLIRIEITLNQPRQTVAYSMPINNILRSHRFNILDT